MKNYLKLALLSLILSPLVFISCKDEYKAGNPNPITAVSVEDADVVLDQAKKEVHITFSNYHNLAGVMTTFTLADGAQMYSPYRVTTARMDLSGTSGNSVIVETGDDKVYYNVYGKIDYAIDSLTVVSDKVKAVTVINRQEGKIAATFNDAVDLKNVTLSFKMGTDGTLLEPSSNPFVADLTKPIKIRATSPKGGEVSYTFEAKIANLPTDWETANGWDVPPYMNLYKSISGVHKSPAYVLIGSARGIKAKVLTNMTDDFDVANKATISSFYDANDKPACILNGSAEKNLIAVDRKVISQSDAKAAFGIGVKEGKQFFVIGDYEVKNGTLRVGGSDVVDAMYGTAVIIKDGSKQKIEDESLSARSGIGITESGNLVFFVCEACPPATGCTITQVRDVLYEFGCKAAINLEGGSGSCLYVGGKITIVSSKNEGPGYFKPIGCSLALY